MPLQPRFVVSFFLSSIALLVLSLAGQAEDSVTVQGGGRGACELTLAWGHTWTVKQYRNSHRGQNFIIQGCNVGDSGFGSLERLGVHQAGPNGDWFRATDNAFGNGGFHLLETWESSGASVVSRNNLLGFMRLTQFHTIGMLLEAERKVQNGECARVQIKFECTAKEEDLTQAEFNRRVRTAFGSSEKEPAALRVSDPQYFENERQRLLHRASQRCGKGLVCLSTAGDSSFIGQCGGQLTIGPGQRVSDECRQCYNFLNDYPMDPAFREEISRGIDPAVVAELRSPNGETARVVGRKFRFYLDGQ